MKKIHILFLISLCVCFFNLAIFIIASLFIFVPTLCLVDVMQIEQIKCVSIYSKMIKFLSYWAMIVALLVFSVFAIKKCDFCYKKINFLYLWFGGTQCVFLVLLLNLF